MSDTGVKTCPAPQPIWVKALLSRELTATEYRLWSYLYWRQGDNDCAWPAQATIATDLGLTGEGVRKITKRLEQAGWLVVTCPNGPGRGSKHCKKYAFTCPQKTPTAIPLFSTKTPNGGSPFDGETPNGGSPFDGETPNGGSPFDGETPNSRTVKPPTAVGVNTYREHLHLERSTAGGERITFDRAVGGFVGIGGRLEIWRRAYVTIDVASEISRAAAWATANPSRGKRNWQRFLTNWLARASKDHENGNTKRDRSYDDRHSAFGSTIRV